MDWARDVFVRNAKLYELVLQGMWKRGEEDALAISGLLEQRGMSRCSILDVPCGIGRVATPLAQLGFTVTGLDLSPHLVSVAKATAKRLRVENRTSFLVGSMYDMKGALHGLVPFDCAVNVFTSIGYGSENDDIAFFRESRRHVRRGGLFLISGLRNRDYVVGHASQNVFEESDKVLVLDRYSFDVAESREKGLWRFYLKVGKKALTFAGEFPTDIRVYSPHELTSMLERTDWALSGLYESLATKAPFNPESPSYALVAEAI